MANTNNRPPIGQLTCDFDSSISDIRRTVIPAEASCLARVPQGATVQRLPLPPGCQHAYYLPSGARVIVAFGYGRDGFPKYRGRVDVLYAVAHGEN